jgi:hypothetical protein
MEIQGDYQKDGYALVKRLIPREVAHAFMALMKRRVFPSGVVPPPPADLPLDVLNRNVFEIYSEHLPPMKTFLWGLTPAMEQVTGKRLIPTYDYFRIYREGDVCRVHRDREACEHSLSLTLAYSDGKPWALEVGRHGATGPLDPITEDFGPEPMSALTMQVGDAVAYQGVQYRHGRTTPNPNRWSAHLFLHWVDPEGRHRGQAFDGKDVAEPVDFTFA